MQRIVEPSPQPVIHLIHRTPRPRKQQQSTLHSYAVCSFVGPPGPNRCRFHVGASRISQNTGPLPSPCTTCYEAQKFSRHHFKQMEQTPFIASSWIARSTLRPIPATEIPVLAIIRIPIQPITRIPKLPIPRIPRHRYHKHLPRPGCLGRDAHNSDRQHQDHGSDSRRPHEPPQHDMPSQARLCAPADNAAGTRAHEAASRSYPECSSGRNTNSISGHRDRQRKNFILATMPSARRDQWPSSTTTHSPTHPPPPRGTARRSRR